eukprot:gene8882-8693_t
MVLLGLLIVLLGGMGVAGLHSVNTDLRDVNTNALPSALAIDKAQMTMLRTRLALDRVVMHPEAADAAKTLQRAEDFLKQSDTAWAEYLALPADAEEQTLAAEMTRHRQAFVNDAVQPLLSALRAGDKEKADHLVMQVMAGAFVKLQDSATALTEFQARSSQQNFVASQNNFNTQLWLTGGIGALVLLTMVLATLSLLQSILGPVQSLMQHFRLIAAGDLSARIERRAVRGQPAPQAQSDRVLLAA